MKQPSLIGRQPLWRAPKLRELGNLRDFVRAGVANGKSQLFQDGNAPCGNESMSGQDGPCF